MLKERGRALIRNLFPGAVLNQAGDADFTALMGPGTEGQMIVYNAAVSAPRTVTLPTTGAQKGQKVFLVRTANATGASAVTFAGKSIAVSNWAMAVFDGAAWIEAAFGSL